MCGLPLFERVLANSVTTAGHLTEFLLSEGYSSQILDALIRPLPLAMEFPGCQRSSASSIRSRAQRACECCVLVLWNLVKIIWLNQGYCMDFRSWFISR